MNRQQLHHLILTAGAGKCSPYQPREGRLPFIQRDPPGARAPRPRTGHRNSRWTQLLGTWPMRADIALPGATEEEAEDTTGGRPTTWGRMTSGRRGLSRGGST